VFTNNLKYPDIGILPSTGAGGRRPLKISLDWVTLRACSRIYFVQSLISGGLKTSVYGEREKRGREESRGLQRDVVYLG
jgi:hypothetical protein